VILLHPAHGFIRGLIAADLASGAYFYQMKAGELVAVKKFVVLK
jgi:hypothetical protein